MIKKALFLLLGCVFMTGCTSVGKKTRLGTEYGWICTSKEEAKRTGFNKVSIPNQEKDTCVEIRADRDPYWDFYIRDYEKDELPKMPDTP